ncbi:hypothetical protein CO731_01674 [Aminobacter sp. MSH1]|uniref:hypothetical protein n=1 Tax=Aminobacter sp. MSH1 TaxID=374606 RepID=UPI000D350B13|nr:hypothetical protein [Aminobacter sp. MSH1]AWC22218.1 hypothetical protein CO731_01674 [Aminobacter sp. MSH1]
MTDEQLREHFGLSEKALYRLRGLNNFPKKDGLIGKTDSRVVDLFFDQRVGIASPLRGGLRTATEEENWDDL